jgi:hypothetical protein
MVNAVRLVQSWLRMRYLSSPVTVWPDLTPTGFQRWNSAAERLLLAETGRRMGQRQVRAYPICLQYLLTYPVAQGSCD